MLRVVESDEKKGSAIANGDMKRDEHKEAKDFAEVNLDEYNSAESLEELGLDHLKHALEGNVCAFLCAIRQ